MINLLPTEYWEYSLLDGFKALASALVSKRSTRSVQLPGLGACIPTRSGRAGIVAAIRALDLPSGSGVGVPLYCCPVVFKAIKTAGYIPRFIDIEPETYCMSPGDLAAKASKIAAVIAVHMFGNVCRMSDLKNAAQGKPIIEDCAQSIGSRFEGNMTGSLGSIGVFSFRSGKYLSVGEGGALYTDNQDMYSRLSQMVSEMPVPKLSEECTHVAATYLRSILRRRPLYGVIGRQLWSFYNKKVDYSAKSPLILNQTYKSDLSITARRLRWLTSAIEQQRENADFYFHNMKMDPQMLCSEKPGSYYNRYLFPIVFRSSDQRDLMANYLFNRGIGAIKPYCDIADVAAGYYGYKGDCPKAEEIARCVVAIPSSYSLKARDLWRVVKSVNAGWGKIGDQ
jgi:perosamine synthetase